MENEFNFDSTRPKQSGFWSRMGGFSYVIGFLFFIELLDRITPGFSMEAYGVRPRDFRHLEGIIFSPFLHGGWSHLIGNSVSLLVLGAVMLLKGWRNLLLVSVVSALSAGVLVFLIGKTGSVHIGASSIVFGYLGYLIGGGFYQRTPLAIAIALIVLIYYGGSFLSALPTADDGISWEAHLGGAIGGFLVARFLGKNSFQPETNF